MLKTTFAVILVVGFSSWSLRLQAQNSAGAGRSADPSIAINASAKSQGMPMKISDDVLASHGFSFGDRERPTCKISGSEGACRVEAFVSGEKTTDDAGYMCKKLDRSTYLGHCVHGKLDGLSLVIADGRAKEAREAFISYFNEGRMAYPALSSYLTGDTNFGVQEKIKNYGCVYFGKWDDSAKRCGGFIAIYGADIFTESNAQKLRDGTFDLNYYRAKFLDFMQQK
jgi:hypothetical protein